MEDICLHCPHIFEIILSNLDDQSLVTCRSVCKTFLESIDNGKILWIRIIHKRISDSKKCYQNEPRRLWKFIMDKAPTKIIKELAKADLWRLSTFSNTVSQPIRNSAQKLLVKWISHYLIKMWELWYTFTLYND